ncbi:uncharacterized protein LOC124141072 isoform X2 [Haliotis rufescens]|uniref:uncharacterized protein LOC124141072 isoform X2 n=1 Tax=Haliotis rufescens TaxID=6454 RepID=UPI00201F99DD|nr:uncharacterized protein LOC124141072 isoform X2 [Haliotis rufescens]
MQRITCVVFVLAVVAMVSSRNPLTKAVMKARDAAGNSALSEGGSGLYLDANGYAESCDAGVVKELGGVSSSSDGDSGDDAFASQLGGEAGPSSASSIACDTQQCPDGSFLAACAFE